MLLLRYLLIRQDKRVQNYASISERVYANRIWKGEEPLYFTYKAPESRRFTHFLPFVEEPVFMVTEQVKKIFDTYQSQIKYRLFGLGDRNKQKLKAYYFIQPPGIDCLSSKTEFRGLSSVKKIVLDKAKINYNNVFTIKGIRENYLLASLIVVEALLSERINEFTFIELEYER